MSDLTHPQTSGPEEATGATRTGSSAPAVTFGDLGEGSIHVFIVPAALALITPLGNLAPFVVILGLVIFALGAQLALRLAHITLPEPVGTAVERSGPSQAVLQFLDRNAPTLQSYQRKAPHWLMARPFDIFPRVLLATTGLVIVISSSVPSMAHVLGVAALLISTSLMTRNLAIFFLGAALLSWSSVLPLLSN